MIKYPATRKQRKKKTKYLGFLELNIFRRLVT